MLIAGSNLAQSNIVSSLKSLRMYYLCALKLIIFPVIGMIILYIFNFQSFDFNVPFTVFIGMACLPEHLLLSLMRDDAYAAARMLSELGVDCNCVFRKHMTACASYIRRRT